MQAPTDNLYKFMAIAGLLCFVFFYFDYSKRSDALRDQMNAQLMEASVIGAKIEIFKSEQSRLIEDIERAERNEDNLDDLLALRKQWRGTRHGLDELILMQAKNSRGVEFVSQSTDRLMLLKLSYIVYGFLSLSLCAVGMGLWYFRTQRYLDMKEAIIPESSGSNKVKGKLPVRK